jgi:hypothetical protein
MLQQHREEWVRHGFHVLQQHEPEFFEHASRVFDRWEFTPGKCHPGAWACTGGRLQWGVLTFKKDPLSMSLLDLATITGHESLHYGVTRDGSLAQVEHECRDPLCSHPADMNADPIYRADRALRDRLATRIAAVYHPLASKLAPPTQPSWSTEKKVVIGVAAVATVLGAFWLGPKVVAVVAA